MIIEQVVMENFGPYYGEHVLELACSDETPITLVHGENMRGKTTLLNAIRWCLYGDLIESERAGTELHELLNYDAAEAGEHFYRVQLIFRHEGYDFELERHVQAPSKPEDDSHLDVTVHLKRGGQFLPSEQAEDAINDILHRDVSRFFLFDGEMLQQYEALVRDQDVKTDLVKRSIERILGLPALRLAVEDLEGLRGKAAKRQRRAVKERKASRELISETEELEAEIESIEEDIEDMREQENELEARRQRLRDRRKQHSAVREEAQRLEAIEERIEEMRVERDALVEKCREHLADGWWQPVVPIVKSLRARLEDRAKAETSREKEYAVLSQMYDMIDKGLDEGECPTCGQEIEDVRRQLEVSVQELRERLGEFGETAAGGELRGSDVVARLTRLQDYDSARELFRFEEKERRIQRLDIAIRDKERTARDLRDALREYDIPKIREIESNLDDVVGELKLLQEEIRKEGVRLQEKEAQLASKQDQIDRLPDADKRIAAEATVYSAVLKSFGGAIERFREKLREQVERESSNIFTALTTEVAYSGLKINEKYGLDIVDDEGRLIKRRSKGAEQVVALSLIAALNRCAVREGPVVMDTPFGRLDEGHRKNIIEFLPNLGAQVVLLVQSGEWGGDEDTELLGPKLGREYEICRDGKPTKSRIQQVK